MADMMRNRLNELWMEIEKKFENGTNDETTLIIGDNQY